MIKICVIICTYDRSGYLPKLIESLKKQTLSHDLFDILLVDNNSTDATRDVVKQLQETMPNIRYEFEQEQGLSIARNRGLREARSSLVVYIDDDAYAEPQWLASVVGAFEKDDEIVCVGGPVELDWQGERPSWVPKRYEALFTSVWHGTAQKYLTSSDYLVGANLAFRREWLLKQGGFPVSLGRKGICLLSGEEAFVFKNVFAASKKAYYHPAAKVMHLVTAERKTKKWFFYRLFWDGATQPILDSGAGRPKKIYVRGAYYDLRLTVRFLLEIIWAALRTDRGGLVDAICRLDQRVGRLYMHVRLAAGKPV